MKVKKRKALTAFLVLLAVTLVVVPVLLLVPRGKAAAETAESKFREAQAARDAGDLSRAAALAEYVVKTFGDRAYRAKAQRILCALKLNAEDDVELFNAAARLYAMDGEGAHGRWALAQILKRLLKAGRSAPAQALADKMIARFGGEEEGLYALSVHADLMLAAGRLNDARKAYSRLHAAGKATPESREKLKHLAPITPILDIGHGAKAVAVGDLDGDGRNEVVFGQTYGLRVMRRAGGKLEEVLTREVTDAYRGEVGAVAIADPDGDGEMELLLAYGRDYSKEPGALEVWEWEGGGIRMAWRHPLRNTRISHEALVVADVNNDGRKEIVLGLIFYGRRVDFIRHDEGGYQWYNAWVSHRPPHHSDVWGVAVGDVARGQTMVAVALAHWNGYGVVMIREGAGGRTFEAKGLKRIGHTKGVAMADLDQDGRCEIVTGKGYTRNTVLFGPGKPLGEIPEADLFVLRYQPGEMAEVAAVDLGPNTSATGLLSFAVGDVDGDGKQEILTLSVPSGEGKQTVLYVDQFRLREGELEEELARETLLKIACDTSPTLHFCRIADADNDGKNEIILFGYQVKILGFD
ncbi:MAG: FG-GAP-like repeat-containing protein, partial [Planctomycetota bacterium]|jgi:hypothetical protein